METWKEVPGYPKYQASDQGRVARVRTYGLRILKPHQWHGTGYQQVALYNDNSPRPQPHYVHKVVLMTFVGPRPDGLIVRHLNGDPSDNRLENLAYGTYSENQLDSMRHGTHRGAKTHCRKGHEYNAENTRVYQGRRYCRPCKNANARELRASR